MSRFLNIKVRHLVFALVVLVFVSPFMFLPHFVTMDGPAHLYNGRLIAQLASGNSNIASEYFQFNPLPVPNWLAHLLIILLNFVFNPAVCEKIIVITYFVLMFHSFGKLVLNINPRAGYGVYL